MSFTVGGVPVGINYMKSVIDSIGAERFIELNPWVRDWLKEKPSKDRKKHIKSDALIETELWFYNSKLTHRRHLKRQGWTDKQVDKLYASTIKQRKANDRKPEKHVAPVEYIAEDQTPTRDRFKFKKRHRVQF